MAIGAEAGADDRWTRIAAIVLRKTRTAQKGRSETVAVSREAFDRDRPSFPIQYARAVAVTGGVESFGKIAFSMGKP
ncbi:hypothetical protein D3C72_1672700 [compost metagenome]